MIIMIPSWNERILMEYSKKGLKGKRYNKLESRVPYYTLPDPLILENGNTVEDKVTWENIRRPEILKLFQENVYGKSPDKPKNVFFEILNEDENALNGKAVRKEIRIYLTEKREIPAMTLLYYVPNHGKGPFPTFFGYNFYGNHTINKDPNISFTNSWIPNRPNIHIHNNRPTEESRGVQSLQWNIEFIIQQGYGIATIYYGDVVPDHANGLKEGIPKYFLKKGQNIPVSDEWGAIGAWAWGLSRALDYFEKDSIIDHEKVIVIGHSRLGKTALWAGASDERFAMVIANNSGCGGAALFRRRFGETIKLINQDFPHWFCEKFKDYNEREEALPGIDQHMLIALIAPRPVYIASASRDLEADPLGEFLSAKFADPVYRLLTNDGLNTNEEFPEIEQPIFGIIGHHIRKGKHDILKYDWIQYINFANIYFKTNQ